MHLVECGAEIFGAVDKDPIEIAVNSNVVHFHHGYDGTANQVSFNRINCTNL